MRSSHASPGLPKGVSGAPLALVGGSRYDDRPEQLGGREVIAPGEIDVDLPRARGHLAGSRSAMRIRAVTAGSFGARWIGPARRSALAIVLAAIAVMLGALPVVAQSAGRTCEKKEFEAVVENAALALRDLNARNAPGFQDKLRLLRERRKWTAEEFMEKAAPFVQDERIAEYDQRSTALLNKINSMGEAGAASSTPDCNLLDELRSTMKALIDTQIEKWAYMFAKIERGLVN